MNQTYDEFVGRVRILDFKIDQALDKAERLRSLCDRVTAIWMDDIRVQMSNGKKREERLTELIDSKRDLEKLLEKREQAAEEITDFFDSVLKPEDAAVLVMKYINGRTIKDVAELMFYTYSGAACRISRAEVKARAKYEERNQDNG